MFSDQPPSSTLLEVLRRRCLDVAQDGTRLPDEPTLADDLQVSRPKLREALAKLEQEGLITRKQGIGIRVNVEAPTIGSRFDRQIDFGQTLRDCGYEPAVRVLMMRLDTVDDAVAAVFGVAVGTPLLVTRKVWLADGRPAMTALDQIPVPGLNGVADIDPEATVFDLIRRLCGAEVRWVVVRPSAVELDTTTAGHLERPVGSAAMVLSTLGISTNGTRLYGALEHVVPGIVDYGLIRTADA
jgi:GntR family transcriptional regulator